MKWSVFIVEFEEPIYRTPMLPWELQASVQISYNEFLIMDSVQGDLSGGFSGSKKKLLLP